MTRGNFSAFGSRSEPARTNSPSKNNKVGAWERNNGLVRMAVLRRWRVASGAYSHHPEVRADPARFLHRSSNRPNALKNFAAQAQDAVLYARYRQPCDASPVTGQLEKTRALEQLLVGRAWSGLQ